MGDRENDRILRRAALAVLEADRAEAERRLRDPPGTGPGARRRWVDLCRWRRAIRRTLGCLRHRS